MSYFWQGRGNRSQAHKGGVVSKKACVRNRCAVAVALLVAAAATVHAQDCALSIINDMTLPPDAALHGTEGMSWGTGEAQPQPIPVPAQNWKGEWFEAMTNWGQVYIPREGSAATNTRCQIRNVRSYLLKNDGTWNLVQDSPGPEGAAFVEDFANNAAMDAGVRDESSNGGGLSVIVGVGPWTGHNYHFWSSGGRAVVDVNTVVGVYTSCEARLIVGDPGLPDDRADCRNLMQMGADWWLDLSGGWLPDWSANSGIAGARARWVTSEWQTFTMCTRTTEEILANPPCFTTTSSLARKGTADPQVRLSVSVNPVGSRSLRLVVRDMSGPALVTIHTIRGQTVHSDRIPGQGDGLVIQTDLPCGFYVVKVSGRDIKGSMGLTIP